MRPHDIFSGVETDAPVRPVLERLRPAVDAEVRRYAGQDVAIHAELRAVIEADGGVAVRRFYWSSQRTDPTAWGGFEARTLYWEGRSASPDLHVFPSDPALTWLDAADGPLRRGGVPERVEVLRYIPLRRLTYRLYDGAGLPDRVIAKAKGAGGLTRAAIAFLAVHRATDRRTSPVRVPRVLRLEPPRHVLYLEELPGQPLDVALGGMDLDDAMAQLGALHHGLQTLEVKGLPTRRVVDWLHESRRAAQRIGLFAPSVATRALALHAELSRAAPADGRLVFCQGDFVPGQVLCHASGWSVIDFDDSHYADPLSEVAAMYVTMPQELGLSTEVGERARRTYLEAYCAAAGEPFDRDRWRWWLVLVQISELSKRCMKGRVAPGEVETVLDRLGPA